MEIESENPFSKEQLATQLFNDDSNSNQSDTNKENKLYSKRNFELVDKLLHRANINQNDLKPLVQNVYFGNTIVSDEYKILQVDQPMLDYLMEGNSLIIRGNETENAVCCSNSKTYSFKVAEVSNPLILSSKITPPDDIDNTDKRSLKRSEIFYMSGSYFTMAVEKPHLQKLKNLLETNLYFGKSIDDNCTTDTKKYKINDLLEIIQASEEEIYSYLNYIEAFQIDGYWRLLEFGFYNKIIDDILKCVDDNSLSFMKLPVEEIYTDLQGIYGLSILKQVVNYFFVQNESDSKICELKKERLFKFYAESLLRSTLKMNYNEFQIILLKTLPNALNYEFKIEYIQSIAYVEEPYIYYLNSIDLPDNIEKRFKYLFEKRAKWPSLEISAFIRDLCNNNSTEVNNALTKYCRPFTQNGVKYYTSRM